MLVEQGIGCRARNPGSTILFSGWGRIVSISSQMGMISSPGKTPYSATKAGLIGFTKVVYQSGKFITLNACEYGQEMPQSQTTESIMTSPGKETKHRKQPAISYLAR